MFNYEIVYMKKRILLSLLAIILSFPAIRAQEYTPTPENLQARKTFQDNKFGIFIHFGVYSMLADGEWIMNNRSINYKEYDYCRN